MFIRLNSYLNKKRTKKDSLGIKQSSIQFFKRVPTLLDTNDITNIKNNLISYYRKNGFLKTQITSQITQDRENKIIEFKVDEGVQSTFTTTDSLIVDNPQLAISLQAYMETKSLVQKGNPLSIDLINKQKEALTNYFRNKGYFYFNPEVIGIHLNDLKDTTLS